MTDDVVLRIVQSGGEDAITDDEVVVLDELFYDISEDRLDEIFGRLSRFKSPPIGDLPLDGMFWPRFAPPFHPNNNYDSYPQGLSHIIALFEKLESKIDKCSVDRISCEGVDEYYLSAIADLARSNDIEMRSDRQPPRIPRVRGFLRGLFTSTLVFFDIFLSLVVFHWLFDITEETEVVFVPHLARFGSMESVLEAADYDYKVVVPVTTVDWLYTKRVGRREAVTSFDPVPISCFASFETFFTAISSMMHLIVHELLNREFRNHLVGFIDDEFDVSLARVVDHSLGNSYRLHLSAIPNLYLADRMIDVTQCQGVVVGSQSLRQLAVLIAAQRRRITSFHLPHTVPLKHEPIPRTNTVHIVPGPAAKEYLTEILSIHDSSSVVALGRPLFGTLKGRRETAKNRSDRSDLRFVIATQPFENEIRRRLVTDILDGCRRIDRPISVLIKTHPRENPKLYSDFERDGEITVKVDTGNLYDHLRWADLTFTINSNVGLESMILGTPCAVVNEWSPRTFIRPALEDPSIPLLRTREETVEFVADLDIEALEDLHGEQSAYVDEQLIPTDNIPENIADYIIRSSRTKNGSDFGRSETVQ